jgi:sugar phosphate permease
VHEFVWHFYLNNSRLWLLACVQLIVYIIQRVVFTCLLLWFACHLINNLDMLVDFSSK